MRDIELFSALWNDDDDVTRVVSLLGELAARPLGRRVPWFAAFGSHLTHRDGRVRAAVLGALRGADGRMALSAFVAGLDDDDARVRRAAVEGLRALLPRDPMRWCHAVFHKRADVRRACTEIDEDEQPNELLFYLLADPECRDQLVPLLGSELEDPRLIVPKGAYATIVEFEARGVLTADQAVRLLHAHAASAVADAVHGVVRPPDLVSILVDELEPPPAPGEVERACAARDAFDGFFSLMARASDPRVSDLRRKIGAAVVPMAWKHRCRATAAARVAMLQHGDHDELALFVAALDPRILLEHAVPLDVRRRAAAGLLQIRHPLPKVGEPMVAEMMRALVIDEEGVRLHVAAGLVCLARSYVPLLNVIELDRLLPAMAADPRNAAAILLIADSGKRGRKWLLSQVAKHDPAMHARVLGWLAARAPTDKLGFIEELEAWQALELISELTNHETTIELKHNKRQRLVELLTARIEGDASPETFRERLRTFARRFLALSNLEERRLGRAMLEQLAIAAGAEGFALAMCELDAARLAALVRLTPALTRLTYGCEVALASVLVEHENPEVRAWARSRVPATEPPPPLVVDGVDHLGEAQIDRVASCTDDELSDVMAPYRTIPTLGLCDALARRPRASPSVDVCAALLGCHDPPEVVAEQFARFSTHRRAFLEALEQLAVAWEPCRNLPWIGSAWLWRWERHAFAVMRNMSVAPARPLKFLERTLELPSDLLRARVWRALGEVVCVWAVRDVARVHELVAGETARQAVDLVVSQLDTDVGIGAAKLVSGLFRAGVAAAVDAVPRIKAMLPDVSDEARAHLARIVQGRGLGAGRRAPRRRAKPLDPAELAKIRACDDPDALERWCKSASDKQVQEAALRAIELGGEVLMRLSELMLAEARVPHRRTLIESVALWPEHEALDTLREAIDDGRDPELAFRLCFAFAERGEASLVARAAELVSYPSNDPWFRPGDYDRLEAAMGERACAVALAAAAQPHAYLRAIPELIASGSEDVDVMDALRAFLRADDQRLAELRVEAAAFLHTRGDATGFPLMLGHALDLDGSYGVLFKGLAASYVNAVVDAVLLAGPVALSEARALQLLEPVHVSPAARDSAHERLLVDAALERTAERIMNAFKSRDMYREERNTALARVARVFAWGTREGLALTRRRHTVHMSERQHLGYTRFDHDKIWVTALPILRGDRHAEEIVEALILHEIGHHRHHRGDSEEAVWKRAEKEHLFGVLNLVADEHLERNLRALDASYGDRLKRLCAHAFRHASRDVPVADLVRMLGPSAIDVLRDCRLGLGRGGGKVRVESGKLLALMEQNGHSFARFMRALRMGLGDRYQDPKVSRALKLFPKRFRHASMEQLFEVAVELRQIFGWETVLCGTYGGHETAADEARERTRWGRGLTDEEVQREVERVLDPSKRKKGMGAGDPNKVWINISPDDRFDLIHTVQRIEPDRMRHREAARDVTRHARTLRSFLDRLGLSSRPAHRRLKGTRLDRGRLTALVTHRDPRVLISREAVRNTDLFLGVIVDCSGSMAGGDNMSKARRFAVLVAEAVRGLEGVDARFFGFTDSVIYDAGDARRCGAASLEAGGGNNDAAALYHAATAAKRSRRKAKVLVMISDGLPTECSVDALKSLVSQVSRSGTCVAQVAVCPLEEVCFPHYVVLEGELDASVRKFGQVVAKLVGRVL